MDFFQDGPASPQDRPTSPGPDIDPESDPQPQPLAPKAARRQAVAHTFAQATSPKAVALMYSFAKLQ